MYSTLAYFSQAGKNLPSSLNISFDSTQPLKKRKKIYQYFVVVQFFHNIW